MTWRSSREIVERIVVEGDLVLLTPTSLGNGDSDGLTDISLLLDEVDKTALLTGTSIAGALRNYLRERAKGFDAEELSDPNGNPLRDKKGNRRKDNQGNLIPLHEMTHLFGSLEDDGAQSLLIIDDARSSQLPTTELRDGVKIDGKTRTAADKEKFDLELLEAGTIFKLRFELLISEAKKRDKDDKETHMFPPRDQLLKAFATALQGFENGEIHFGARKRRGYGECEVKNWTVKYYNLKTKNGLLAWLGLDKVKLKDIQTDENNEYQDTSIATAIKTACNLTNEIQTDEGDKRAYFELDAWFALDGSMLIRSGSKLGVSDKAQPDSVHLRSKHKNKGYVPIVSGTSLAGVLRHRAVKICNTIADDKGQSFVERIFGVDMEELKKRNKDKTTKQQPFASRLEVRETFIENTNDLVQTRIKIDRFTGGAYEGALFDAAPVFSTGEQPAVNLKLRLRDAKDCEIGLLLLLLKDLWTSDLAIGGESSIGRGRLKGKTACLKRFQNGANSWSVCLEQVDDQKVKIDGMENNAERMQFLNKFVKEDFKERLK